MFSTKTGKYNMGKCVFNYLLLTINVYTYSNIPFYLDSLKYYLFYLSVNKLS